MSLWQYIAAVAGYAVANQVETGPPPPTLSELHEALANSRMH